MRMLFVTPQIPFPPRSGGAIRSASIILHLAREHRINVLALSSGAGRQTVRPSGEHPIEIEIESFSVPHRNLRQRALDLFTKNVPDMSLRLYSPALASAVEAAVSEESYDIIQIEGLESVPSVARLISKKQRPPVIYDAFNAEYQLQKRAFMTDVRSPSRWMAALYSLSQWRRLASYEQWLYRAVDAVTAVSDDDRKAILARSANANVIVVPSGVDTDTYFIDRGVTETTPDVRLWPAGRKNILFTGTMDYRPNIDAMQWFCKEIFPAVLRRTPDVHLWIVGRDPGSTVGRLAGPGITVTGEVEDDLPYFRQADVFVLPMRYGGGVRLKLLQAMSCGLPVVSTPAGLEGV
ncbi:MAG: glycosyltransferase, partial [Dehalococcoidia bacterium]|nr:glycosyltransferase [Dehalococcoidia bacterium]